MDSIYILLGLIPGVILVLLGFRALQQWQDLWRLAAIIPTLLALGGVLNVTIATWFDPTFHNTWPNDYFGDLAMSAVLLALIYLFHRLGNRKAQQNRQP